MKTILIERVSNGWIVRPFEPSGGWSTCNNPMLAVYTKIEDLQQDIPRLCGPETDEKHGQYTP